MKRITLSLLALALVATSFAKGSKKSESFKVDASKSSISWIGKKVTGQHSGTINLKEGNLNFKGKKLTGGSFVVNMTSLNTTDLSGEYQEKLNGHLKDDDFFGTEKYPTSKLVFKKIADKGNGVYNVTGDLTIKDVTAPINFVLTVKGATASTSLKIDRTKFGIKYGSGSFFDSLGDRAIADEFELNVNLQF